MALREESSCSVAQAEAIRAPAKEVAQWPTFPQVCVGGELIGGRDIVAELYRSGELARLVGVAP